MFVSELSQIGGLPDQDAIDNPQSNPQSPINNPQ
jgi:hypothetical protein